MTVLSPILRAQVTYPFVLLAQKAQDVTRRGIDVIDFGTGDPREPTDPRIIEALRQGLRERMGYPTAAGLPELRVAISDWARRRFGVSLDPDGEVIPTLGSKEAIFSFAQVVLDPERGKDTVLLTEPGYPVYERGALFAGAQVATLPLREENGFLPDVDAVPDSVWKRTALLWVNFPNNPTGVSAAIEDYRSLAGRARRHDFVLASDEAYSELWFESAPPSALQLEDTTNVVVFNTLSKRSSMTGYRSGFVAGDRELIAALKHYRPSVGTAPQEFVQRASIAAWGDETHVERARVAYARKRDLLLRVLETGGVRVAGGAATMYLWVAVGGGETSEEFATRLLERGILVTPGSYLGPSGEGYARFALVPTLEECARAAEILEDVL